MRQEGAQLGFDHPWVQSFQDADDPFQHHLLHHDVFFVPDFELSRRRQAKEVRQCDTINRGNERDGDAFADFIDIVEMLHHLDQAKHRADDADRRSEASRRFEDLRNFLLHLGFVVDLKLHDLPYLRRFCAVHGQHQSLLQKGVGNLAEIAVEGNDATLACLVREFDNLREHLFRVCSLVQKNPHDALHSAKKDVERKLHKNRPGRPAHDNHGGCQLRHLCHLAPLHHHGAKYGDQRKNDATYACNIHGTSLSPNDLGLRELRGMMCNQSCVCGRPRVSQNPGTVTHRMFQDFSAAVQYNELLAVDQRQRGVWNCFHVFDQVTVDQQRMSVQACKFDHDCGDPKISHRRRLRWGEQQAGHKRNGSVTYRSPCPRSFCTQWELKRPKITHVAKENIRGFAHVLSGGADRASERQGNGVVVNFTHTLIQQEPKHMSLGVLNNISAIYAQNNLGATQNNLSKTLQQLSSGSRINSGADDAAGLAVADGLSANETALAQSSRNASDATGLLQTADGALSQVTTLLNRAVTLATQAANGTLTDSQVSSANQEYQNILTQVGNIGATTNFNGSSVFTAAAKNFFVSDGTTAGSSSYNDTVGVLTAASIGTTSVASSSASVSLTTPTTSAAGTASHTTLTLGAATHTVSGTLALKVGTGSTHSITVASGTSLSALATQINADSTYGTAGIVAAYNTGTGVLTISGPATASSDLATTGTTLSDTTPANSAGAGVDFTQAGVSTLTGASAKDVLTALTSAIGDVAFQRGSIGANINQLASAQSVAQNEQTNLTAAEDNIRATDYGQAASNLSKYQVLSQTGISALAQANSVQQEVTKLLQ